MKDEEGVHEWNRDSIDRAGWRLQEEREVNLCNKKKRGEKNHTDTHSLTLTNSLSLSLPTQLSGRPVLAFSHLVCIGDTCTYNNLPLKGLN